MTMTEYFGVEVDFELICISSAYREHILAHVLNTGLSLNLARSPDDLEVFGANGDVCALFPVYLWTDNSNQREFTLLGNRSLPGTTPPSQIGGLFAETDDLRLLLPELPKVDYFLLCRGQWPEHELSELVMDLRRLSGITTAFIHDTVKIKNIENLIF